MNGFLLFIINSASNISLQCYGTIGNLGESRKEVKDVASESSWGETTQY